MEPDQLRLYQHLKSIAITLHPSDIGDDYYINTSQVCTWLIEYDRWFKESVGINDGNQPYTLYNREVSLFGVDILSVPAKLKHLVTTAINLGYATSITVDIVELYNNFDLIKSLCDNSLLSSLGIHTNNMDDLAKYTSISDFMGKIISLRRPIGIIGSISLLQKYQVLKLESVNGTDITIYPLIPENSTLLIPINPEKPCANRMRLYIDKFGYIYPCLGLVGLKKYSIGHVYNDIKEMTIMSHDSKLNLLTLMNEGPALNEKFNKQRISTLPWVCEQHRANLIADV